MRLALVLLSLALAAGCVSHAPVPYHPQRAVVASIPPERAREELARLLARAYPENPSVIGGGHQPLADIEVGADAFAFRGGASGFWSETRRRIRYADAAPSMFIADFRGVNYSVNLTGSEPRFNLLQDVIWFKSKDDAEMAVDALESLKAGAGR